MVSSHHKHLISSFGIKFNWLDSLLIQIYIFFYLSFFSVVQQPGLAISILNFKLKLTVCLQVSSG